MANERVPLDRLTWVRWRTTVHAFVTSEVGVRAALLFATLFALLLAINGLNVLNSFVGRDFMTAIEARSMSGFVAKAILYVGVFAASTVAAVIYRFTEERLGLLWREWLTRRLIGRYLEDGTYYWLREDTELQNPDQRIADDVRTFTATTLSLTLVLLNTTFTIVAFSGVLWSISPLLFATAVGYAALGSGATLLFGRPLIWLNYDQADREANLRADLVHLRENAESVAVLRREGRIGERLFGRVDRLVENTKRIIAVNRNLGFFTTGYNYLIQIIPVLIVAPLFIRGEAQFGEISQSSMAFSHLLGAFSLVVTQFGQISSYAVVLARLGRLGDSVDRTSLHGASELRFDDTGEAVAWDHLTLRSNDASVLLESLTAAPSPGQRVLVTGPNEAARLALFRATAGLWNAGQGRIVRPPPDRILFLPERPYLPPGTLRQALVRSERNAAVPDAEILAALEAFGCADAVRRAGGLDAEHDWDDLLSLAEQQMLSFARVVIAAPGYAIIDRPTTLLGVDATLRALDRLAERRIVTITFAPDRALASRHDVGLELEAGGRWSFQPMNEGSTA
jgi:putative ATP-binding cassette transporter